MKSIPYLVAVALIVTLVACSNGEKTQANVQVNCAIWNTQIFFEAAGLSDVTHCLRAGADPNVRTDGGATPLHFAAAAGAGAETVTALFAAERTRTRGTQMASPRCMG